MNLSSHFELNRFWSLLKLEVFKARQGLGLMLIITFGVLFFMGMLLSLLVEQHTSIFQHDDGYSFTLILGGCILSSMAFKELGDTLKRYRFLTLPVSAFERFLCVWLLTTIGWIVLYTIVFTVYTWVANPIGQLIYSKVTFEPFNPFSARAFSVVKYYIIIQSVFLVGASHFKKFVFGKTLVVIISFATLMGFLLYFSMKDIFLGDHYCTDAGECELIDALGVHYVWFVIKGFFWWVLAPLSWVLTYFGIKGQTV